MSDSFARRMTIGLFFTITAAISSAVSRSSLAGHDAFDRAERQQLGRGDRRAHEEHGPQLVLRHEAGEVGRDTERAPVDLGQPEGGVVGGDHDVGVAGETDAAADAEALHRGDDRDLAVVDRAERLVTAAVHADQRLVRRIGRQLLDVDAGLEALALGPQDHDAGIAVAARSTECVGELEPARDRQRVHGRVVDGDDDDVLARFRADHARSILPGMVADRPVRACGTRRCPRSTAILDPRSAPMSMPTS